MCSSAPLMEFSGDQGFLRRNEEFARKIKSDVVALKERLRAEFHIGPDKELQLMREILAIPPVPLNCQSNPCNVEDCFNQIRAGLHTFNDYLSQIAEALPSYAEGADCLRVDIANLSTNIQQQMEESGLPTIAYPQANQVLTKVRDQKELGSYIILDNFKGFLEMTIRAMRHCGA